MTRGRTPGRQDIGDVIGMLGSVRKMGVSGLIDEQMAEEMALIEVEAWSRCAAAVDVVPDRPAPERIEWLTRIAAEISGSDWVPVGYWSEGLMPGPAARVVPG